MSGMKSHIDILVERTASHGGAPFFKAVRKDSNVTGGIAWDVTTYAEFGRDVDALSTQFRALFQRDGVKDGAVIGVWLNGLTYSDIVHLYALCKAGYIPDMLSTALTDPSVVIALLSKTGAAALLHEPHFNLGKDGGELPTYTPIAFTALRSTYPQLVHPTETQYGPERTAFIQYTSGSTSDMPKAIRCSNKWLKSVYDSWASVWNPAGQDEPQDVFNIPGSVNNPSGLHVLLMGINFGGAFVQSTTPFFSSEEFLHLTSHGGLNRLNTFAPVLCPHIQAAQQALKVKDDSLLKALRNMRSIVYGGMPMLPLFENWAFENKLPIMNALGTTETGPLLHCAIGEHPQRMRPFPGLQLEFEPLPSFSTAEDSLFKLAVLGNSSNIPDHSLLTEDGKFYTGDLFTRGDNGTWSHRGREGDWIKIAAAKLVDTKTVEDFIRQHCSDIVAELVVVGTGRPSLALLAEPVDPTSGQFAKNMIVQRLKSFNQRRFEWERLSADKIAFVARGALPRTATKGNVRRKAAEMKFEKELDKMYA